MGNFANRRLGWKFVIRKPRKKVARFIVTGALAGFSSVAELDWETILSSTTLPDPITSTSSSHLHTRSIVDDTVKQEWLRPLRAAQSKIPYQLYQRPSASTIGPTPQLTSMETLFSFYNTNGEHMQLQTDNENPKKPSTPHFAFTA